MIDFHVFNWNDASDRKGDRGFKPISVLPTALGEILVVENPEGQYIIYGLWFNGEYGFHHDTLWDAQNRVEDSLIRIFRWIKKESNLITLD